MKKILLIVLVWLLFIPYALAKELYVSKIGNDSVSYGNNDITNPWLTINHGINMMQPGDILYIRKGLYSETILISSSGSADSYKIVKNYNGETPILDATGYDYGIKFDYKIEYWKIIGIEIKNATRWGIAGGINNSYQNSYIEIKNCNIHNNGSAVAESTYKKTGGMSFETDSPTQNQHHISIINNTIHHNFREALCLRACSNNIIIANNFIFRNPNIMRIDAEVYAVKLSNVDNAEIYNNYFYFSQKSIRFTNSDNNKVYNNVFAYMSENGLDLHTDSKNNTINNNVFAYNGYFGVAVKTEGTTENNFYHNIFYGNGCSNFVQESGANLSNLENNIFNKGYSGLYEYFGTFNSHDYNDYYDLILAELDSGQTISQWIGDEEANSVSIYPNFVDINNFKFYINNPNLSNITNNPIEKGNIIGLYEKFIDTNKICPYIQLMAKASNIDKDKEKSCDLITYPTSNGWHSDNSSGWLIWETADSTIRGVKYIGLVGGGKGIYYSPKDFHIAISTVDSLQSTNPQNDTSWQNVLDATYVDPSNDDWSKQIQWFEIPNAQGAKYIKLTIDNSQKDYSGASNSNVQVAEFYAIGPYGRISPPSNLEIVSIEDC